MSLNTIKTVGGRALLNLGCGTRFHPDWNNVDLNPTAPSVRAHNLHHPLPFSDNSFDAVYHSHVLEHFSRIDGIKFLKECYRVCRVGGIIRVVVPNLEKIARVYLDYLKRASRGETHASYRYDWMMLELYDQTVRTQTGGEMANYLRNSPPELAGFLVSRIGQSLYSSLQSAQSKSPSSKPLLLKLARSPGKVWYHIRAIMTRSIGAMLWGRRGLSFSEEVLVRLEGEVHRWMYDRYSLRRVLEQVGFSNVTFCSVDESRIEGWIIFRLDCEPDGTVYKPESLFCEGVKR